MINTRFYNYRNISKKEKERRMIRVTIELIPHGNDFQKKTLGIVDVINNGDGTKKRGNYLIAYSTENTTKPTTFKIKGHKRDKGFLPLIKKAIRKVK